ncbi:AaceriABL156Cp [[Ashbya] aceris (nom. inval.)]|nr:AaceriABL156Cp [[Ashbya] aceris (nom. inval.)]
MMFKGVITSLSFLLLLGSCLLGFFTILSGAKHTGVLRNFYWLEANTSNFNQAPPNTRWYNYNWCEYGDDRAGVCSNNKIMGFSPRDHWGDNDLMPENFITKRDTYFYLSRVGWAMLLIGLFFMVLAILPYIVSIFTEKAAYVSTPALWLALFFVTLAACLYTACYVKARNAFHSRNRYAKLGPRNFAFIWTTVALLFLNCVWSTFLAASRAVMSFRNRNKTDTYYDPASDKSFDNSTAIHSGATVVPSRKNYFREDGRPARGAAYDGEVLTGQGHQYNNTTNYGVGAKTAGAGAAVAGAAGAYGAANYGHSESHAPVSNTYQAPSAPQTTSYTTSEPYKVYKDPSAKAPKVYVYSESATRDAFPEAVERQNKPSKGVSRNSGRIVDPTEYQTAKDAASGTTAHDDLAHPRGLGMAAQAAAQAV